MSKSEQCVYENYTETEIESKTFIYTWKITNFIINTFTKEDPLISKSFSDNDKSLWNVILYEDLSAKPIIDINVEFDIEVLPDMERRIRQYCFYSHIVRSTSVGDYLVYQRKGSISMQKVIVFTLEEDFLLDEKNKLLVNGDLTLRFKICIATGESIYRPQPVCFDSRDDNKRFDEFEIMLNNPKFSDVTIVIGDKKLYAYKGILAARSPVFTAMFEHEMKENIENVVKVVDVDYNVMQEVLRFIYAAKVNNIKDIAKNLLAAADKYEIKELKLKCEKILINDLTVESVSSLLIHAEKYRAEVLKKSALNFFKRHAKEIIKNDNYEADISSLLPLFPEIVKYLIS